MLYLTTRDHNDAYTVHKTMVQDMAPDGGAFIPFQIPCISEDELHQFETCTSSEIISDILNRFYSSRLNGWSVDVAIGRNCMKTVALSQKIVVTELWHNPAHSYDYATTNLFKQLSLSEETAKKPTIWTLITIKIAVLFASYVEMLQTEMIQHNEEFDVAVNADNFTDPIAAWYAKQMGLPLKKIVCSCDENDGVWDLIHRGQISTSAIDRKLGSGLERLIYHVYGEEEASRFCKTCDAGKLFAVDPECEIDLADVFFCAVMGQTRADVVMNSLKRTDQYNLCADAALAYGAIQDYRAKTGENRVTLLFSNTDAS